MGKILKIIGLLVGLFLAVAVIVPLVVDVDQYRPEIVKVANENLNGHLEIGKLSLSLWGQIKVQVDGVKLSDQNKNEVISVKDAFFHLPFFSILSGSPILTFKMQTPSVKVLKNKKGEMNVLKLIKETKKEAPKKPVKKQEASKETPSGEVTLPALVTRARLGVEFIDAQILFQDQKSGIKNELNDMNIRLKDISLSRETILEIWADLDTQIAGGIKVHGPFRVDGKFKPELKGTEFQKASAWFRVDLDQLEVTVPGAFRKSSSVPTNLEAALEVSQNDMKLEKFLVVFHNAQINTVGGMSNLKKKPKMDFKVSSNEIEMGPWSELIPPLKDFDLSGSMTLNAAASGPTEKFDYQAKLRMKNWSAKAKQLKAKPVINGTIDISTDQIKKLLFTFEAPGNDLRINGKLVSFSKPQLTLGFRSKGMDLDRLIAFPPPKKEKASKAGSKASGASDSKGSPAGTPKEDLDKSLDPLRKNKMARQASALITADLKFVQAYGVRISDISTKFKFRNLVAAIEHFRMKVFQGKISSQFSLDMKPKRPKYSLKANVQGFDLKEAVTSQLELFKNTLYGQFDFDMQGGGASFNPDLATKNLNLSGKFNVKNAKFASVDISKMTSEAINEGLTKAAKKVPQLKGKTVRKLPKGKSEYEFVRSNFTIRNGKFKAPNFYAKSKKNAGVDLKGNTEAGLEDMSLSARWEILDTHNMTGARDLSPVVNGTKVNHILARKGEPVILPITVGCFLANPCYRYTEVPGHLAGVAAQNVTRAVAGRAQKKAKKAAAKVIKKIEKKAPKPVQKKVKDIRKKFGF